MPLTGFALSKPVAAKTKKFCRGECQKDVPIEQFRKDGQSKLCRKCTSKRNCEKYHKQKSEFNYF